MNSITGAGLVALAGTYLLRPGPFGSQRTTKITLISLTLLSAFLVYSTTRSLSLKQGLPFMNQVLAWCCLTGSILFLFGYPRAYRGGVLEGLACLFLGVGPSYVLLSTS